MLDQEIGAQPQRIFDLEARIVQPLAPRRSTTGNVWKAPRTYVHTLLVTPHEPERPVNSPTGNARDAWHSGERIAVR